MNRAKVHAAVALALFFGCTPALRAAPEVRPGDIVFQTSRSSQSQAIQLATHSPYSHMGMVLFRSGRPYVLEAAGRVQFTALADWASRGQDGTFVIKRLKDASLLASSAGLERLTQAAQAFMGRPYDPYFGWSDDRIYCSELVWKAYERGLGIKLGDLARLSTFDLSNDAVKKKLVERYGEQVPMDEQVISPASMFSSVLLETVQSEEASTWDAYVPRTFQAVIDPNVESARGTDVLFTGDNFPSRVTVLYTGQKRALAAKRSDFVTTYFTKVRKEPQLAKLFKSEILVRDGGAVIWVPIQESLLPSFSTEVTAGATVTLFTTWLGAFRQGDQVEWIFTVNEFESVAASAPRTPRDVALAYWALCYAAADGNTPLVKELLKHGAPVDAPEVDSAGEISYQAVDLDSPLQAASDGGHVGIVAALLERKPWVDHRCCDGPAALGMAARKGHLEIVKRLLAAGADPTIQSDYGSDLPSGTPLDAARAGGHVQVVRVLESAMKAKK